jgi:hypothetical protein
MTDLAPGADADVAAEVAAVAAAAGLDIPDASMASAEEVRAPIASFQDQIINPDAERKRLQEAVAADAAAMDRRMSFDRPTEVPGAGGGGTGGADGDAQMGMGGGEAINKLFAPPAYNESKPYYDAIEQAKLQCKWVLVNIQQAEVFASHTLNRDVWCDETITDIVTGSFIFWQRDDKSTEGDQFCQMHSCGHQLPHICIVDPRTGRRVKSWDGRKWAEQYAAAEHLFGFLDEFSMSRPPARSPQASPAPSPPIQPQAPPAVELTGLDDDAGMSMPPAAPEQVRANISAMPEEPAETEEHLKVCFKLPSGQRLNRRFRPGDPLGNMFAVASASAEQPESAIELATQFPTRSLRGVDGGMQSLIRDAGVAGNVVLVSVRAS